MNRYVYVVVFEEMHEGDMLDSIWATEAAAEARRIEINDDYCCVRKWQVKYKTEKK
jgi:hypothetical protein